MPALISDFIKKQRAWWKIYKEIRKEMREKNLKGISALQYWHERIREEKLKMM